MGIVPSTLPPFSQTMKNLGENQAGDLQLPWRVVDTPQKKQQYLDEYRGIPMRFQNIHNNPGLCLLTSTCSVALG